MVSWIPPMSNEKCLFVCKKKIITFLKVPCCAVVLTVVMVFQREVPQPEVDQACEDRETGLGRALERWEREIIKAFLTNEKLRQLLLKGEDFHH